MPNNSIPTRGNQLHIIYINFLALVTKLKRGSNFRHSTHNASQHKWKSLNRNGVS